MGCGVDIEQFVTLLVNSRLCTKDEAHALATVFQEECRKRNASDTVETFCDFLIATNRLTAYQCEKLRMGKWKGFYLGKWKGFYLDNYLLLEQIGKDREFCYYKARDTWDSTLVRLIITPMVRARGPGIEYRVERYLE